jgi:hypothetical protein
MTLSICVVYLLIELSPNYLHRSILMADLFVTSQFPEFARTSSNCFRTARRLRHVTGVSKRRATGAPRSPPQGHRAPHHNF